LVRGIQQFVFISMMGRWLSNRHATISVAACTEHSLAARTSQHQDAIG